MPDTYLTGPDLGPSAPLDLSPQAVNAMPDNSAPAQPPPDVAAPAPDANLPPQQPQSAAPTFGSLLAKMLPGPHYDAPDPQSSALDQSASLLQQRISRASQIATNPLAAFFAPEQVAAARTAVPAMTEQLQQIQKQKATIQAGRAQAQSMGLTPDEAPDQATQDDRIQVASNKALKGDMRAFQGIQAVAPDHAAAIAPQVYAAVTGHLNNAQTAFDSLSGMENERQYQAKIKQLRADGTLTDLESLGLKLPPTFEAFNASKASEGLALRNARIAVNSTGQQLEDRNTYQPMAKDEAATYDGRLTTAYGDKITNGTWGRNAASNTRGFINNGLATPDALGKGGTLGNADQRTQIGKDFANAVPDKDLEKYRNFNRTYALATQDSKGNPIPSQGITDAKGRTTYINDNPNVQQGIAEGLASMLRGGTGGATAGLLNIESSKRGAVQSVFDKIQTAYAGTVNTLTGEQVRPYLTQLTEEQQRQVLDGLKNYTGNSITDRSLAVARRAGALGFGADALGLGQDEAGDKVNGAIEEGRQAQIARMRPNFQAIGGGDGVLQLNAQRPGASAVSLPPGAQPYNQLPGAQPLLTPVQQAGQSPNVAPASRPAPPQPIPANPSSGAGQQPNAQPASAPQPTSGSPQPVTVAGQQVAVALPPGASPAYVNAVQSIESGGQRNPWTAGTKNSSASGAYQFTDPTWKDNKPPGAPARAADATPDQQTAALEKLTATNATALHTAGLPVNDTSLYVTHNLGASGGPKLLQASPNADARTVVGEAAAKNNPQFFRGRPTVAVALQRYDAAVNAAKPATPQPANPAYASRFNPAQEAAGIQRQQNAIAGVAPAALSTVGALAGGAVGGPPGAVAGGAAGGGAGQALKDYLRGNPQSGIEIAKQTALGGVLGVGGLPRGLNMVARAAGSGAIEAGDTAAQGGTSADVADAAMRGAGEAAGGEAFGRALGMVGHKVFSLFSPNAKAAVQTAAKTYADSSDILDTEAPKLPGVGGAAGTDNPKYVAAQDAQAKAEQTLKDAGLDPEEAAYAHRVSSPASGAEPVPTQEAQAGKPGVLEQKNIGAGYQQLESEVGAAGVGAPKETPKPLQDGPLTAVVSGKVSAKHTELAQRTENAITAPAADWQEKWNQLKDARSNLLQAERDALGSTATGKTQTAADMRTLADTVRTQQAKAANYVFGPQQGPQVMQRLNALDVRYRRLMDATNGGDLAQAANLKGAAGRDADQKFRAFAANDPTAIAAWNAMRNGGTNYEKGVYNVVAAEGVPILGKVYSGIKLLGSFNRWMQERAAGSPAKFSDILNGVPQSSSRGARDVAGTIAQRGAVMGGQPGATP